MENKANFIDLGLPSGTLWAKENEKGLYAFDEAVKEYGNNLPTLVQFKELTSQCQWKWIGDGYKVTGPNGNFITLLAAGFRSYDRDMYLVGSSGYYWSSMPNGSDDAFWLGFNSGCVYIDYGNRGYSESVRLVNARKN